MADETEKTSKALVAILGLIIIGCIAVWAWPPPEINPITPLQLYISGVRCGNSYKPFVVNTTNLYHSTHYNIETPGIFGGLYLEMIKPIPEDGVLNIVVYSSAKLIIIHYWTLLKDGNYFLDRSVAYQ